MRAGGHSSARLAPPAPAPQLVPGAGPARAARAWPRPSRSPVLRCRPPLVEQAKERAGRGGSPGDGGVAHGQVLAVGGHAVSAAAKPSRAEPNRAQPSRRRECRERAGPGRPRLSRREGRQRAAVPGERRRAGCATGTAVISAASPSPAAGAGEREGAFPPVPAGPRPQVGLRRLAARPAPRSASACVLIVSGALGSAPPAVWAPGIRFHGGVFVRVYGAISECEL